MSNLRTGRILTNDEQISTGQAFLQGELEKFNNKVAEPLSNYTWSRDIEFEVGGGALEYSNSFGVDYATVGKKNDGWVGTANNQIPSISANFKKELHPIRIWKQHITINRNDLDKFKVTGRNMEKFLEDGLRTAYNKELDQNVYYGIFNSPGIINNPSITTTLVPAGAGASTTWALKTPSEILKDINNLITTIWKNVGGDISGLPDHILLPFTQFGYIATQTVSTAGNISILEYVLKNNICAQQGVDLMIFPSIYLSSAGAGGTSRMVGYNHNARFIDMDITVPLQKILTHYDVKDDAYVTIFESYVSEVKFNYLQTFLYADGI